jgi:hypothetical protein
MAQQGFLGRFRRWMRGPSDTYFFGLQIAIKCFGEDTVRARFARVLTEEHAMDEDVQAKRRFLRRFMALLDENELFWTYGYWDYLDDPEAANAEFTSWTNDIENSMAAEDEELGAQVDDVRRTSSRKDYVVVTLAFLLDQPYAPAEAITHEDAYFLKETFTALVQGLTSIDPNTIQADGVYVVPGNAADGLSEDDLLGPGWEYLRLLL